MNSSVAATEQKAIQDVDVHHSQMWRFVNSAKHGPAGYPTSYEIMPGSTGLSLLDKDDWPQRRAAF